MTRTKQDHWLTAESLIDGDLEQWAKRDKKYDLVVVQLRHDPNAPGDLPTWETTLRHEDKWGMVIRLAMWRTYRLNEARDKFTELKNKYDGADFPREIREGNQR